MPAYNGSGTWSRSYNWTDDYNNAIDIDPTRQDAEWANVKSGFDTAFCRDGQATATGNFNLGGFRITNLAAATALTDAARLSQIQSGAILYGGAATGTDTITFSLTPSLTAYAAGQRFTFKAAGDNTGAVTVNINSVGAKDLKMPDGSALAAGYIKSGQMVDILYDGTNFQITSPFKKAVPLNVQVLTTLGAGTYTPTSGTRVAVVLIQGAGGGGNGGGSGRGVSSGGGAGGFAISVVSAPSATSISIGTGGTTGVAGGNTVFDTITCAGGSAGAKATWATGKGEGNAVGASGGAVSGGSPVFSMTGQSGGDGTGITYQSPDFSIFTTGAGGDSFFGRGGKQRSYSMTSSTGTSLAGDNAVGYGAGGSGAGSTITGTFENGGTGGNGIIVVYEYA